MSDSDWDHALGGMHALVIEEGRLVGHGSVLGALSAPEQGGPLYAARGWKQWRGKTWGMTPEGIVRTAEEDGDIYVLQASADLHLDGDLTCDWREGDLW